MLTKFVLILVPTLILRFLLLRNLNKDLLLRALITVFAVSIMFNSQVRCQEFF